MAIMPIGRLIQKIHRHPGVSVMKPPTAGPIMRAHPVMPLKMPSAHARSSLANAPLSHRQRHHQGGARALGRSRRDQRLHAAGQRECH
jgi:hypothetical protein